MSRGAGAVERKITDSWAASNTVVYTPAALVWRVFNLEPGAKPSRAQRISVLRAARRILKRIKDGHARDREAWAEIERKTEAELGRKRRPGRGWDDAYEKIIQRHLQAREKAPDHPASGWREGKRDGLVVFHYFGTPLEAWAVKVQPAGVAWAKAEIIRISERHVMVRYQGETARLDRFRFCQSTERIDSEHFRVRGFGMAWWRGVLFASSRSSEAAAFFDDLWWKRHGTSTEGATLKDRMPLAEARALLRLPEDHNRADILRAFRKAAFKAHPDAGGSAELFRRVVEARDRLLAALGMKAAEVKMPEFAPKGVRLVYRSGRRTGGQHLSRSSALRLGRGS
jgi:hypothetical protein